MPFVANNGLSLHVQAMGHEGPPLLMLHGFLFGSMATWYFGAAPKLARRFNVVLSDLRGHGLSSPADAGYDLATLAADLHVQVPLAGSGSATLVGHSYGALVAMRYAIDHPGRVRQLVIVDAPLPPAKLEDLESFLGAHPDDLLAALPEPLQHSITSGGRQGRRLLAQLERLIHRSTLIADIGREPPFTDHELASLDIPTLLVYGDRSGCRPAGERLARALREVVPRLDAAGGPRQQPLAPPPPWGEPVMTPREAFLGPQEAVPFAEAAGRIAAESLAAYPPGIPNVLPGERLTGETLRYIEESVAHGGYVRGSSDRGLKTLRVAR